MSEASYSKIVRSALENAMRCDKRIFVAGEDVSWGGTMKLYYGLAEKFPGRIFDTPVSETAIAGLGIGSAAMGLRPMIDFNLMDFTMCAMDEIVNQMAKFRFLSPGNDPLPLVVHVSSGLEEGAGPQHCQSLEALYCHAPGIRVVAASDAESAACLLLGALQSDDPVILIDALSFGLSKWPVPERVDPWDLDRARVLREGRDVTVVAYGAMVGKVLDAADRVALEGIEVEVIDLVSLSPLDKETVLGSVSKTGRLVIAHEAVKQGGIGAEVAALASEEAHGALRAPIIRLGAAFGPIPFSPELKKTHFPQIDDVRKAIIAVARNGRP